jgi:hypothetical protein
MKGKVRRREMIPRWIVGVLLFILSLFAFSPNVKAAVTGKIAGIVRDARTGEPLPGANILIEGTDRGAACDVDGYYYIIRLEPGAYNVQARMIGYKNITKIGVRVISGHTTPLDFQLEPTVVPGEGVVVEAEREVIKMDLAGSSFAADKSEIEAVPLISGVKQYINLQAGIAGWSVRGGSQGDTRLLADGLLLVDQRANEPIMMPNLSEIKEVRVEKGGFTAEYANVRSGVINVVTREGSPGKYEGSFEFRYTPGYQKHSGKSIFDPYNYNNAIYLWNKFDTVYWHIVTDSLGNLVSQDTFIGWDSVCWKGTRNVWGNSSSPFYDTIKRDNYPAFAGWIYSVRRDTGITTAEMQRDRFLWMRRINVPRTDSLLLIYNGGDSVYAPIYDYTGGDTTLAGYEKVAYDFSNQDRSGEYGNKPDWTLDAGFGGPIPVIGSYLGNMTFYTSYRDHNEMFAIPDSRDYYRERMASLKLTSRFGNFKVNMKGAYSIINSLSPYGEGHMWQGVNLGGEIGQVYLRGGSDMLFGIAEYDGIWHGSNKLNLDQLYRVNALTPFDVTSRMYGFTLQHALSENTFYDVHLTYIRSNNRAQFNYDVPTRMKGDTVVLWFLKDTIGITKYALDDLPFGWADPRYEENYVTDISGDVAYGFAHQCGTWNTSWSQTYSAGFDMSSQLNKYNLIKFGLSFQYDKLHEYYITNEGWFWPAEGVDPTETYTEDCYYVSYDGYPILAGGYIQDKIEFEGMFANFGLRFDYSDPNIEWPSLDDPYSLFLSRWLKDYLFTDGPVEDVAAAFKISPRLGISFPVLEKSKLFFNYGHFYSLPASQDRYKIDWGTGSDKVHFLGNPRLEMERTVSYEVGLESSIASTYMARISGYYKDIDNETEDVRYYGEDGEFVDYYTPENNGYGDTRGFEFEFRKAHGRFFTGWVNYDYMVRTSGKIGVTRHYEVPRLESNQTEVDPEEDKPIPQPVFRAQLTLKTPGDWGIFLGGYNLSFLYQWRAGYYETFDAGKDEEQWGDVLQNNIQWPADRLVDMSINKNLSIGGVTANLFMDVHNIFNWGTLNSQCFDPELTGDVDRIEYFKSLHLEIYDKEPFVGDDDVFGPEELEVEPDHIGDLRSEDKPYINNPNRDHLYYLDPRYVQFGIRFSF